MRKAPGMFRMALVSMKTLPGDRVYGTARPLCTQQLPGDRPPRPARSHAGGLWQLPCRLVPVAAVYRHRTKTALPGLMATSYQSPSRRPSMAVQFFWSAVLSMPLALSASVSSTLPVTS